MLPEKRENWLLREKLGIVFHYSARQRDLSDGSKYKKLRLNCKETNE